jgi:hypothetical protein
MLTESYKEKGEVIGIEWNISFWSVHHAIQNKELVAF